ncbi:hypothetical protein GCM10023172_26710 [Hymenobacter ginsengisoli]|uniref:Uncharacterized protein n=1 Tax=Hymenobacter ginsengisoli TaxID=1051626 RepID=A0ABP8QGF0_9BACT|nr:MULTISPECIES: hypothetical protein [unclassified Hymenobacter]MBO2030071.1 hypothetical protein [Hymenobacter sp. BT559]
MEPTPTRPNSGYTGSTSPSYSDSSNATTGGTDSQFSTTAAHATGTGKYPTDATTANSQPSASGVQATLNNAVASGKKWLNDSGISDKAQQLPQSAKDLGNKALNSVSGLTNTQKAVGVGLLAAGVAFLVTRGSKHKKHHDEDGEYRHKARRSPFDHQPHTKDGDYAYDRKGQRPWGASRYGAQSGQGQQGYGQQQGSRSRVTSGSGYSSGSSYGNDYSGRQSSDRSTSVGGSSHSSSHNSQYDSTSQHGSGHRRDQGPASGSRYDANSSGGQNPNNLDQLNSAY